MSKSGNGERESTGVVDTAWYCVQAKNKQEHIAAAHLREVKGVAVFLPRIRFQRQTRTRTVWVTEALFPGYLFARFELGKLYRLVEYSPGVRSVVRFANRYPTIDGITIAELQKQVGDKEIKVIEDRGLPGEDVKIGQGALAGLEAVITQILPARARVRVLMDLLGRKLEVELDRSAVLRRQV